MELSDAVQGTRKGLAVPLVTFYRSLDRDLVVVLQLDFRGRSFRNCFLREATGGSLKVDIVAVLLLRLRTSLVTLLLKPLTGRLSLHHSMEKKIRSSEVFEGKR